MKPFTGFIVCLVAAVADPVAAQTLGQGRRDDIPWLQLASGLGLCILLAVAAALMLRRRLNPKPSSRRFTAGLPGLLSSWGSERDRDRQRITQIETRRLPGQVTVTVVRCDDQDYLVSSSAQGHLVVLPIEGTVSHADQA